MSKLSADMVNKRKDDRISLNNRSLRPSELSSTDVAMSLEDASMNDRSAFSGYVRTRAYAPPTRIVARTTAILTAISNNRRIFDAYYAHRSRSIARYVFDRAID